MTFHLYIRLHFPVTILIIVFSSPYALGGTDVDLETSIAVGSRAGLFASIYTSGDDNAVEDAQYKQTGIVSSQANISPKISFAVSSKRIRFTTSYFLALSNNVMLQDEFNLNMYHQGGLQLITDLSRRLTLSADASISSGLLDYSTALYNSVSDSEIPANLLPAQELRFYNITSSVGLNNRWSRRASSSIHLSFSTYRTLGYNEGENARLPDQYQTALSLNYSSAITKHDNLNFSARESFIFFDPGNILLLIQTAIGWRHILSKKNMLNMSAGLVMEYILGNTDYDNEIDREGNPSLSRCSPLGEITYSHQFKLKKRKNLNLNLSGIYNYYLDQMTASSRQRVVFNIGLELEFASDWTVFASGSISSLVTEVSASTDTQMNTVPIDYPTMAYLNLGASYSISQEIFFNFGITSNARWAELWSGDFRARAFEEFVIYISISASKRYLEP